MFLNSGPKYSFIAIKGLQIKVVIGEKRKASIWLADRAIYPPRQFENPPRKINNFNVFRSPIELRENSWEQWHQ